MAIYCKFFLSVHMCKESKLWNVTIDIHKDGRHMCTYICTYIRRWRELIMDYLSLANALGKSLFILNHANKGDYVMKQNLKDARVFLNHSLRRIYYVLKVSLTNNTVLLYKPHSKSLRAVYKLPIYI